MTQEDLAALCEDWQRILRLQDWDLAPLLISRRESEKLEIDGQCVCWMKTKQAIIRILTPDAEPGAGELYDHFPHDAEETLVHELLELHFDPFKKQKGPDHEAQEQAINLIANALVRLKRQKGEC